jgi:phage major head subunit gpT-like protein
MAVVINPAATRIFQEFSTENIRALSGAMRVWRGFAMEIPSSSRSTLHAWLASTSAFVREWKDSRVLNEMGTLVWEVVNRKWELSWRFHEDQIRDDLAGLVAQAIMEARGMADKWAEHEDSLVATTVQNGKTKACYDGQNFFSASHPTDPTRRGLGHVHSNLLTATSR